MVRARRVLQPLLGGVIAAAGLTGCSTGHHAATPPTGIPASTSAAGTSTTTAGGTAPAPGAGQACPVPGGSTEGPPPPPTGLVAVKIYQPGQVPFESQVFTDPWIHGVDLLAQWNNLEPAPNEFDWTVLDCLFSQADQHDKFVVLTLIPGFDTPAWVLALPGVSSQSFRFSYAGNEPARQLPLPWNQPYLTSWFGFLAAVAARYGTNPAFRVIQAGGPTSVSTEMSLPDATSGDTALPPSTAGSDIAEWMDLGYTPARYVAAWTTTFSAYHRLFPNQYMALALFPGLPIGDSGARDPAQQVATPLDIIAAGLQYRQSFVLQEDGLKGDAAPLPDPEYNFVKAHCGSVVTGLQNSAAATAALSTGGPLSLDLAHGIAAGVDFLELFEPDALNPAMKDVLTTAGGELPATKGCTPLTLSGAPQSAGAGRATTLTATTDLALSRGEDINIYEGSTLLRTCPTTTCSIRVSPPAGTTTTYTADVGAPGTVPSSDQAIVSATTAVTR